MAWILLLHTTGTKILVFLLVFLALLQSSRCDLDNCHLLNTPGITIPEGDIIIEHGKSLEIFCKLHDDYMRKHSNITSADIEFNQNTKALPSEWVTHVNESTAKLYVENPPPSHSMYTCKLKGLEKAICLNTVIVGTKPSDVLNFSCIGYNYENMTCSWVEPEHYVKTAYNLTYYFKGRGGRPQYECPNITRKNNLASCFWDISTRPHYRQSQPTYYFNLNMTNKFGDNTQKIIFSHFANVIPEPPENLTVLNRTSDSVTLRWSVQHSMMHFPPSVMHRVVYQSEYDKKDEWHVANTTAINKINSPIYHLTGLKYAHVLYDIRVSMISSKARINDDRMWSKNVSVTVRTQSALPGAPPRTNIGSFEIVNNKTGRDIYLYWQSIPEHLKNGENFSYKVMYIKDDSTGKHDSRLIEPAEVTNSYARIVSISYMRHKFKIVSVNEVGHSLNSTEIVIPAYEEQVKEPSAFTKISFGNQVYELSWVAPPSTKIPVESYTIFYCRNDYDRPYQCKGYLEWIVVPSSITVINVTVPEDKIYQFAISANSKNSSSGMVWASCTVIHDKGFTKMKSLWINSIGSDYIEVGWKLDCSDRIGNIEGFTIYYCPIVSPVDTVCNGNLQNITITGDPVASRGKIKNLRPYTTYMLKVAVRSKHNNGLPSEPLFNTTMEGAPDPPENVTIENITSTSMVVKWSPPKNMNGVLRYYEVRYSHNGREYEKRPLDEKSPYITLDNLHVYTEYNISVYAATIKESNSSEIKKAKTAISVPAKMRSPNVKFQNDTLIQVDWSPPDPAGGNLDIYELRVKEKINSVNYTKYFNTSDTQWYVPSCGTDRTYKVLYFSIRAINYDEKLNKRYEGDWSDETENSCRDSSRFVYWFAIVCGICLLALLAYVLKKLWFHCKIMRDVEVKLPPGLTPAVTNDLSLNHWPVTTLQKSTDDPLMHIRTDSSADEELLLAKKAECGESHDRITSGDSSGCSSGHESVTSSLASGTNLSSTSDSGTEQPRTPSSESASRENSLRQRRTGSETLGWDSEIAWPNTKGYVLTMPLGDKSALSSPSWNANKNISPSNYCVLGVDTVSPPADTGIHGGYVPVPITVPHIESSLKNSPYITCDSIFNKQSDGGGSPSFTKAPAYVKNSDTALIGRPMTSVALSQQQGGNNVPSPTYVMAGNKGHPYLKPSGLDHLSTGKLINIEPLHDVTMDTYMQHSTELDNTANAVLDSLGSDPVSTTSPYVKTDDILSLKDPITTAPAKPAEERAFSLTSEAPDNQQAPLNSYCRLGWDRAASAPSTDSFAIPSPRTTVMEPNKGYVPHRQFESKSLKED